MNPFAPKGAVEVVDIKGTEDSIVMLECQDCGETVNEGKYFPKLKVLSWQCSKGHISKQPFELDD